MLEKDYILRSVAILGRALARVLFLTKSNRYQEALIFIDQTFRQALGFGSELIAAVSDDVLLGMITPRSAINVQKCLLVAALLKAEGDIYQARDNPDESYYRYLKSLYLYLEVLLRNETITDKESSVQVEDILQKLEVYELPMETKSRLLEYYEKAGNYGKAEDILFELVEANSSNIETIKLGMAFYTRLQAKSDRELLAGNFSREEVAEGLAQLVSIS